MLLFPVGDENYGQFIESSLIANLRFVQIGSGLSGLNVSKIQAVRTKGDYNLVSSVQKELQSGNYDIQM